jgi:hypothetical protein
VSSVIVNLAQFEPSETSLVALDAVYQLFRNWAIVLLYISLILFLCDREGAIRNASGGKAGGRNVVLFTIHIALVLLIFVFGIAAPGVDINAEAQFDEGDEGGDSSLTYDQQINVFDRLNYAFNAFVCLTNIAFFVSVLLLHKSAGRAGLKDPVSLTSLDLFFLP